MAYNESQIIKFEEWLDSKTIYDTGMSFTYYELDKFRLGDGAKFSDLVLEFRHYININALGEIVQNILGFYVYCLKTNQDFKKTIKEYIAINEPYNKLRNKGLVDATAKAKSVFGEDLQMNKMYFCEFYKIPRFGKTRVGQLLLHAKQTQNEKYIRLICEEFAPKIREFAKDFESICFAPPTTPRALQFMDVLKEILDIDLPLIETSKIFGDIAIQQKTLKSRQDRVENANATIVVKSDKQYKNCLIIDDAIGSGSTLNQIALKLKVQKIITDKVVGLGIVGNLDGFEVINEV
jgi:hypothetical protein